MLRALVLLLLVANLGFAAWSQGWLRGAGLGGPDSGGEAARLGRQVHPERLVVLGPGRDAAPAPRPAASRPAAASAAAPQGRANQARARATQ